MYYINEKHLIQTGINWNETINEIAKAVLCLKEKQFAQPVKPYLRFNDPKNRVIAMPAYIGNDIHMAGIKWIASFPDNIKNNIPRAHSVVILNNANTGEPVCIINAALLSIIRTVSVSGYISNLYVKSNRFSNISIGITGFGPIGQYHALMMLSLYGNIIDVIKIYDIQTVQLIDYLKPFEEKIKLVSSWENAYKDMDIFITCTVSKSAYIDKKPKPGSLHLNVSLRDYRPEMYNYMKDGIIVDSWEEVNREKTDIEYFHIMFNLQKSNVKEITDITTINDIAAYNNRTPLMFNPMGMAVFDIAIGSYYFQKAKASSTGMQLD